MAAPIWLDKALLNIINTPPVRDGAAASDQPYDRAHSDGCPARTAGQAPARRDGRTGPRGDLGARPVAGRPCLVRALAEGVCDLAVVRITEVYQA
ncbi:hypothetical protein G3I17_08805 [Streptomyces sp. SID13031]|nr:hypothetical protein [Streptomyces sp. SID13031]